MYVILLGTILIVTSDTFLTILVGRNHLVVLKKDIKKERFNGMWSRLKRWREDSEIGRGFRTDRVLRTCHYGVNLNDRLSNFDTTVL